MDNFNPRPPHGGRRPGGRATDRDVTISIHAPRMGGDEYLIISGCALSISIHAPRMGGDYGPCREDHTVSYFNPRPPHGGRQVTGAPLPPMAENFNPRPPHGGRPALW